MSERLRKAQEAARLRRKGLLHREIAERMGISVSYAGELIRDPDGTLDRQRKDGYRQPCVGCGVLTNGSDGVREEPRCVSCANRHRTIWTREALIDAIRAFAQRYGRPPRASDWNPADALRLGHTKRSARFYDDGCWPYVDTVQNMFGSWSAGIEAAGFEPFNHETAHDWGPGKRVHA